MGSEMCIRDRGGAALTLTSRDFFECEDRDVVWFRAAPTLYVTFPRTARGDAGRLILFDRSTPVFFLGAKFIKRLGITAGYR